MAEPGNPPQQAFTVPKPWRKHVHPRRGGGVPSKDEVTEASAAEGRAMLATALGRTEGAFAHPVSDPALVRAAREHLGGASNPVGAAAVAALAGAGVQAHVVDAWVLDHGLAFAACAALESGDLAAVAQRYGDESAALVRLGVDDSGHSGSLHDREPLRWHGEVFPERVRRLLATASDADHALVEAALSERRATERAKAASAYLVPARADWVDEAITALAGHRGSQWHRVLQSVGSLDQLRAALDAGAPRFLLQYPWISATLADAIGPDFAPEMAELLGKGPESFVFDRVIEVFQHFTTPAVVDALLEHRGVKRVETALLELGRKHPELLLDRLAASPHADLLEGHLRRHHDLAARADLPEPAARIAERVLAEHAAVPAAAPADLPPLLVDPPWLAGRASAALPVVALPEPTHRAVRWRDGERERWGAPTRFLPSGPRDWPVELKAFLAGGMPEYRRQELFAAGPVDELRPLLPDLVLDPKRWDTDEFGMFLVARFGVDAVPPVLTLVNAEAKYAEALLPLESVEVARLVAARLHRPRSTAARYAAWLRRHPEQAARLLLPDALGAPGSRRDAAEEVLRRHPDHARAAAAEHTPEAVAAVEALLAVDPLDLVPAKPPAPGAWCEVTALPRLLLRDGRALPDESVRHVTTMLAMTGPDTHYAGLDALRELCDETSLVEFAWAVFELWVLNAMPAKDSWALTALGVLGDDRVVRRLEPLIRAWPGQSQHHNAVRGLDVLARIGTDTALIALNGVAQRVKFAGLKGRAEGKVAEIAEDLGLTGEQLADRLVPAFGLDEESALVLDYGPRRFTVGFDESLRPYVLDEAGKRLKSLPKPGAKDDPELAPAASKRFGQLKKDVRTVASLQIARLEAAMVEGRRWSAAEFRDFLVGHPLVVHLVRRLVWVVDGGGAFRVAEDRGFADARDEAVVLPDDARVGVAHPVHLGDEVAQWQGLFEDYTILQPFSQLDRPVRALAEGEAGSRSLDRFVGAVITTTLPALRKRRWELGPPLDAGIISTLHRPLPGGGVVNVQLDHGMGTEEWHNWHGEGFRSVTLQGVAAFGELDPVTVSELLDELIVMTAEREEGE
ncbi:MULTISPECIES: DUF4132 domain-containing protein [Actinosynnema]|uniref:DUF4132 domain-containing protein n=1 Tax=Actinosynnema TaxID=40566 RepID=UPI0027E222DD|nr:DUF4132 domain-containing protein [Actinosynnema pretiosum]MCP2098426.1 protein of unknown function (DUF4132) [Actinosynnema pretiosum]